MSDDQTLFEPLLKPGTEISSSVRFFFDNSHQEILIKHSFTQTTTLIKF